MNRRIAMAGVLTGAMLSTAPMGAKVSSADTRVRVDALHRVWSVALASGDSEVKVTAIGLLTDPVGSSSDHIRMPAVYTIAEIANSTDDARVKVRALRWFAPSRAKDMGRRTSRRSIFSCRRSIPTPRLAAWKFG